MNCQEAIADLMRSIDANAPTSEQARAHLRECERCRALLTSVSEQVPAEEVSVESSALAAEAAVAKERKRMITTRAVAISVAIIVFGLLMLIPLKGASDLSVPERLLVGFTGVCIAILIGAPFLILFSMVARAKTPTGQRRFYRRLGPGRWWEGVCLGIAEATGLNVGFVRGVFVLLAYFKGVGLLAYIICTLAMPVHPADRQYLWRFQIARAWRRMRHGTADAQQHS
ncbi:MAG TPA: PspC domain-containing protein [Thermoanaerobaculia bacterium]|jgi:phage shock protein PspC (stress-responsive transcriptional regulator)